MVELDLADLDQIPGSATTLRDQHGTLAALVCNAGVMGGPLSLSKQGFELGMATNHLGHAALVAALWPLLESSASRVVLVSSGEARGGQLSPQTTREQLLNPTPYDGKQAYRDTKQANLLFAQELHRRCSEAGSAVSAVAAHPGVAGTNLLARQLVRAGHRRLASVSTRAHHGAPPIRRGRRTVHAPRARPPHPERRVRRPVRVRTAHRRAGSPRRLPIRQGPCDRLAPVGAHRAGAQHRAAGLTLHITSPAPERGSTMEASSPTQHDTVEAPPDDHARRPPDGLRADPGTCWSWPRSTCRRSGDDDVLIRVRATSVNTPDLVAVTGLPRVLRLTLGLRGPSTRMRGSDVAGVVAAVGSHVTDLQTGDEVFGSVWDNKASQAVGTFAEFTVAPAAQVLAKPASVSFEDAAASVMSGLTALRAIRDVANVTAGCRVLINGASGGVGTFAVQIAKTLGAEVTGVCSASNVELVSSLGADHVIDYTQRPTSPRATSATTWSSTTS